MWAALVVDGGVGEAVCDWGVVGGGAGAGVVAEPADDAGCAAGPPGRCGGREVGRRSEVGGRKSEGSHFSTASPENPTFLSSFLFNLLYILNKTEELNQKKKKKINLKK